MEFTQETIDALVVNEVDIMKKIAEELNIRVSQVSAVISLVNEGCTIPFISRYRKEAHGSLDEVQVRDCDHLFKSYTNIETRRIEIVKGIFAQGKLNEALYAKAEGEYAAGDYKAAKNDYTALGDYSDAKEKAERASEALAAQEEAAEIKSAWSDTLYFQSRQGGFFTFEFEWGQGASKPSVYFSDSAGRHSLSIKEMTKSKMVLSDSRGVTHTLTKKSSGGYNWQWQSTSGISFN